jgi:hypothetical protein
VNGSLKQLQALIARGDEDPDEQDKLDRMKDMVRQLPQTEGEEQIVLINELVDAYDNY